MPHGKRCECMNPASRKALIGYLLLFGALYAGFGVQSPYVPRLLKEHGLAPGSIGTVLAAGTAIRLAAGPAAGRLADWLDAARLMFAGCAAAAAIAGIGYFPAYGFWPLLAVVLLQAAVLAPLAPLSDAFVLVAAGPVRVGFDYGWVRGAGSAAFIIGSILSGQLVAQYGLSAVIMLNAALLIGAAISAAAVPRMPPQPISESPTMSGRESVIALLRLRPFRRVVLVASLVLGSHALHDGFAMIRWNDAGIAPGIAGLLWAESVAAEVLVFFLIGRPLVDRLGPAGTAILAATAGALRWAVSAEIATLAAIAAIQPLHGVTFALLHLACMRRLAQIVPPHLSATALTIYGLVGIGAASAVLTLLSGWLYGEIGAEGFWVMVALCLAALPLARKL
jgi:MFS transporter, PPP family, 3-phenylpropionic acid transporter